MDDPAWGTGDSGAYVLSLSHSQAAYPVDTVTSPEKLPAEDPTFLSALESSYATVFGTTYSEDDGPHESKRHAEIPNADENGSSDYQLSRHAVIDRALSGEGIASKYMILLSGQGGNIVLPESDASNVSYTNESETSGGYSTVDDVIPNTDAETGSRKPRAGDPQGVTSDSAREILKQFSSRDTREAAELLLGSKFSDEDLKLLLFKLIKHEEALPRPKRRRHCAAVSASLSELVSARQNPGQRHSVDWSRVFQELLALSDSIDKFQRMAYHAQSFLHTAETYGKIIISETYLPVEKKTIKPLSLGGIAGGEKFICEGILFKYTIDTQTPGGFMYGGSRASQTKAMKSGGHELKGMNAWFSVCDHGLINFPLMVLIDYRGFRLVAISLLPVDKSSIVYGSSDGGKTVHAEVSEFNEAMARAGGLLNLQEHRVGNVTICGPGDIEGHKGRDGKLYLLDFARTFPPEAPPEDMTGWHSRAVFYEMLRPELVRRNPVALSSDALTMWQAKDPRVSDLNAAVYAASRELHRTVIPRFGKRLWDNPDWAMTRFLPLNLKTAGMRLSEAVIVLKRWRKSELVRELHRNGVNVRHIGRVRSDFRRFVALYGSAATVDPKEKEFFQLQSKQLQIAPQIDALFLIEIVSRVIKVKARRRQRRSMERLKLPSEDFYISDLVEMLNLALGSTSSAVSFWSRSVVPGIIKKFGKQTLLEQELTDIEILRSALLSDSSTLILFCTRLTFMLGIDLTQRFWQNLFLLDSGEGLTFLPSDIESINARVKYQTSVDFVSGCGALLESIEATKTIFSSDPSSRRRVAQRQRRLLLHATEKLTACLHSNTTSAPILKDLARAHLEIAKNADDQTLQLLLQAVEFAEDALKDPILPHQPSLRAECHLVRAMTGGMLAIWEAYLSGTKTREGSAKRLWQAVDTEFDGDRFAEINALYDLALSCEGSSSPATDVIAQNIRYWLRRAEAVAKSVDEAIHPFRNVFASLALLEALALRRQLSERKSTDKGETSRNEANYMLFLAYLRLSSIRSAEANHRTVCEKSDYWGKIYSLAGELANQYKLAFWNGFPSQRDPKQLPQIEAQSLPIEEGHFLYLYATCLHRATEWDDAEREAEHLLQLMQLQIMSPLNDDLVRDLPGTLSRAMRMLPADRQPEFAVRVLNTLRDSTADCISSRLQVLLEIECVIEWIREHAELGEDIGASIVPCMSWSDYGDTIRQDVFHLYTCTLLEFLQDTVHRDHGVHPQFVPQISWQAVLDPPKTVDRMVYICFAHAPQLSDLLGRCLDKLFEHEIPLWALHFRNRPSLGFFGWGKGESLQLHITNGCFAFANAWASSLEKFVDDSPSALESCAKAVAIATDYHIIHAAILGWSSPVVDYNNTAEYRKAGAMMARYFLHDPQQTQAAHALFRQRCMLCVKLREIDDNYFKEAIPTWIAPSYNSILQQYRETLAGTEDDVDKGKEIEERSESGGTSDSSSESVKDRGIAVEYLVLGMIYLTAPRAYSTSKFEPRSAKKCFATAFCVDHQRAALLAALLASLWMSKDASTSKCISEALGKHMQTSPLCEDGWRASRNLSKRFQLSVAPGPVFLALDYFRSILAMPKPMELPHIRAVRGWLAELRIAQHNIAEEEESQGITNAELQELDLDAYQLAILGVSSPAEGKLDQAQEADSESVEDFLTALFSDIGNAIEQRKTRVDRTILGKCVLACFIWTELSQLVDRTADNGMTKKLILVRYLGFVSTIELLLIHDKTAHNRQKIDELYGDLWRILAEQWTQLSQDLFSGLTWAASTSSPPTDQSARLPAILSGDPQYFSFLALRNALAADLTAFFRMNELGYRRSDLQYLKLDMLGEMQPHSSAISQLTAFVLKTWATDQDQAALQPWASSGPYSLLRFGSLAAVRCCISKGKLAWILSMLPGFWKFAAKANEYHGRATSPWLAHPGNPWKEVIGIAAVGALAGCAFALSSFYGKRDFGK